jgi:hypothetical protein
MNEMARSLSIIASDIRKQWTNVSFAAEPYLSAMNSLNSVTDSFGLESGSQVIRGFLANASGFRGKPAKKLKKELTEILGVV